MNNKFLEFFNGVRDSRKGKLMSEFITKLDIDNINNDYIDNYINYWILYENGFKKNEIDKLWMKDNCLKNYYNTNYADTIFSVFIPLKKCIKIINKGEYNKNPNDLLLIKENKNTWFAQNADLYESINNFAKAACTIGNVINYPYIKNKINFNSYRGLNYQDLFLHTLYECFDNGEFSLLFAENSNYKSVEAWVEKNKLEMFFKDSIVKKDNIINIGIQDKTNIDWDNIENIDDMKKILNEYTRIINERTSKFND